MVSQCGSAIDDEDRRQVESPALEGTPSAAMTAMGDEQRTARILLLLNTTVKDIARFHTPLTPSEIAHSTGQPKPTAQAYAPRDVALHCPSSRAALFHAPGSMKPAYAATGEHQMTENVRHTIDDQIAKVTLHRPQVHNAFDDVVVTELTETFNELSASDAVRVVVLQTEGKHFSAGADINWMKRMVEYTFDGNVEDARKLARMLQSVRACNKPVIARVHGATFGGGVGLVAACDIAVATKRAAFALSEVRLGIIPAVISPFVIEKIGPGAARRYALTAERFDADEARRIGLINEVVESVEQLDAWIADIAETLKSNGPEALAECKRILSAVGGVKWDHLESVTSERTAKARIATEGQEGLKAFLEKRPPNWVKQK